MEPTILNAIILSDYILRDSTGKVSLIGCFSAFCAPEFPFSAPIFYVTPFLTNLRGKHKSLNVAIRIEDLDSGHVYSSTTGGFRASSEEESLVFERDDIWDVPVPPFQGVTFDSPGAKKIVVLVNGENVGERHFMVVKIPNQAQ